MNRELSSLELLLYPIVLTAGFGLCFYASRMTDIRAMRILGIISLALIGVSWLLWLLSAFIEIRERMAGGAYEDN
jgi:hypothetical protein